MKETANPFKGNVSNKESFKLIRAVSLLGCHPTDSSSGTLVQRARKIYTSLALCAKEMPFPGALVSQSGFDLTGEDHMW